MFDAMAEWMTVPLLQHEGGQPPQRIGLAHTSIAPYGVFKTPDGADILIAIQSDREWRVLAEKVLGEPGLGKDPKFRDQSERVENRAETDAQGRRGFACDDVRSADREAGISGYSLRASTTGELLSKHAHLRRITVGAPSGPVSMPAPAPERAGEERTYGPIPALGEHTELIGESS